MIKLGDFVIFVSLNFDIFTWKASHITARPLFRLYVIHISSSSVHPS